MPARIFARVMDWGRPNPDVPGGLTLRVEWSRLDGARSDGKYLYNSGPITNRQALAQDIASALLDHLAARFPTAGYTHRDIVLWS